jgi:hypothetical protein
MRNLTIEFNAYTLSELEKQAARRGAANIPTGLTLTMERAMPKAAPRIHFLDLADEVQREGEFTDTRHVVTCRRELLDRVAAALRFAIDPAEDFVDRVAHAIVGATAPLFEDFDTARDAARAAIEAIGS